MRETEKQSPKRGPVLACWASFLLCLFLVHSEIGLPSEPKSALSSRPAGGGATEKPPPNAADIYAALVAQLAYRTGFYSTPPLEFGSRDIRLTGQELRMFLRATSLPRCEFYQGAFRRYTPRLGLNHGDMARYPLFGKIARAALRYGSDLEKAGQPAAAEEVIKAVVRFGRHIRAQDDEFIERRKGFAIEFMGLEGLVDFYARTHQRVKRHDAQRLLRALKKQDESCKKKYRELEADRADLKRMKTVWLKDPEILWRRTAVVFMLFNCRRPATRKETLEILGWVAASDPAATVRSDARYLMGQIRSMTGTPRRRLFQ